MSRRWRIYKIGAVWLMVSKPIDKRILVSTCKSSSTFAIVVAEVWELVLH